MVSKNQWWQVAKFQWRLSQFSLYLVKCFVIALRRSDKKLKVVQHDRPRFLGNEVFRRVRKIAKSDYQFRYVSMSVRPSFCPHGITRRELNGFSLNLTFQYFSKICRKIGQEKRAHYTKTNIYIFHHTALISSWKNVSRQKLQPTSKHIFYAQ